MNFPFYNLDINPPKTEEQIAVEIMEVITQSMANQQNKVYFKTIIPSQNNASYLNLINGIKMGLTQTNFAVNVLSCFDTEKNDPKHEHPILYVIVVETAIPKVINDNGG